jgi:hypothetical protein
MKKMLIGVCQNGHLNRPNKQQKDINSIMRRANNSIIKLTSFCTFFQPLWLQMLKQDPVRKIFCFSQMNSDNWILNIAAGCNLKRVSCGKRNLVTPFHLMFLRGPVFHLLTLIISWVLTKLNSRFNSIIRADATCQVDLKQDLWWQFVYAESEFKKHWREIIQNSSMLVAMRPW